MQNYANTPKKIDKLNEITNKVNGAIAENDTITPTVAPVIIQSQSLVHPRR